MTEREENDPKNIKMGERELLTSHTHWEATPDAQSYAKIEKKLKMGNFDFNTRTAFAFRHLIRP